MGFVRAFFFLGPCPGPHVWGPARAFLPPLMLVQIKKNICNLEDVVMRTESISVISLLLQGFSTIYPLNLLLQCWLPPVLPIKQYNLELWLGQNCPLFWWISLGLFDCCCYQISWHRLPTINEFKIHLISRFINAPTECVIESSSKP